MVNELDISTKEGNYDNNRCRYSLVAGILTNGLPSTTLGSKLSAYKLSAKFQ